MTRAALMCAHHHALKLYGNKIADWAACIASWGLYRFVHLYEKSA